MIERLQKIVRYFAEISKKSFVFLETYAKSACSFRAVRA